MISETRYYITRNTHLGAELMANGVGSFLQIDPVRSDERNVFMVFTPVEECEKFAEQYYSNPINHPQHRLFYDKLFGEIQIFKKSLQGYIAETREGES